MGQSPSSASSSRRKGKGGAAATIITEDQLVVDLFRHLHCHTEPSQDDWCASLATHFGIATSASGRRRDSNELTVGGSGSGDGDGGDDEKKRSNTKKEKKKTPVTMVAAPMMNKLRAMPQLPPGTRLHEPPLPPILPVPPPPSAVAMSSPPSASSPPYTASLLMHALSPKYRWLTKAHYGTARPICQILLEYGADPNLADSNGMTPLQLACESYTDAIIIDLIHWGAVITPAAFHTAINKGRSTIVAEFLRHHHVDVNCVSPKEPSRSPLVTAMIAACGPAPIDHMDIIHYLLSAGASWPPTPVLHALFTAHITATTSWRLVSLLVQYGDVTTMDTQVPPVWYDATKDKNGTILRGINHGVMARTYPLADVSRQIAEATTTIAPTLTITTTTTDGVATAASSSASLLPQVIIDLIMTYYPPYHRRPPLPASCSPCQCHTCITPHDGHTHHQSPTFVIMVDAYATMIGIAGDDAPRYVLPHTTVPHAVDDNITIDNEHMNPMVGGRWHMDTVMDCIYRTCVHYRLDLTDHFVCVVYPTGGATVADRAAFVEWAMEDMHVYGINMLCSTDAILFSHGETSSVIMEWRSPSMLTIVTVLEGMGVSGVVHELNDTKAASSSSSSSLSTKEGDDIPYDIMTNCLVSYVRDIYQKHPDDIPANLFHRGIVVHTCDHHQQRGDIDADGHSSEPAPQSVTVAQLNQLNQRITPYASTTFVHPVTRVATPVPSLTGGWFTSVPSIAPWIGGSISSSLVTFNGFWIDRQYYTQLGPLATVQRWFGSDSIATLTPLPSSPPLPSSQFVPTPAPVVAAAPIVPPPTGAAADLLNLIR